MIEISNHYPYYEDNNTTPLVATAEFKMDHATVFAVIAEMIRDLARQTYVKPFQWARESRKTYFGLFNHFLGPNNVNNMANHAKARLESIKYSEAKRYWTFENILASMRNSTTSWVD